MQKQLLSTQGKQGVKINLGLGWMEVSRRCGVMSMAASEPRQLDMSHESSV
jgi:hypothetical protein